MKSRINTNALLCQLVVGLALILGSSSALLAKSSATDGNYYTAKDKEFYLTADEIYFIRPGLKLQILDATIPADLQPEVTFMLSDPGGLALDRDGVTTPGPVSTSFILAYIPQDAEAYVAYTTRTQTSPITNMSAEQASTDSGGSYTDLGGGQYMYKFGTALPADYDADATHTLGIYARRDLREYELDRYVDNQLEHFVPSGASAPVPRDIVRTETCNGRCHDPLAIHGGARTEVGLCVLCHNATQSTDPDTGNSVYMPEMIHKIHKGADLANGYTIIGYNQGVHDYSEVVYPGIINDCEACHTGGIPTDNFPLVASPNPVPVCDYSGRGITELNWDYMKAFEIHLNAADGPLFAAQTGVGSKATGKWAKDGTTFYLVDKASGDTVQKLNINATVLGCVGDTAPGTFRGEAGAQHTEWLTSPTRVHCGSCHDHVNFETGEGHVGGAFSDDSACSTCHTPSTGNEYDRSIRGAHTVEYKSQQLPGLLVTVMDVTNTGPGARPTVKFKVGTESGPLIPAELNRLRFSISGPNEDFSFYAQETVGSNAVRVGETNMWTYTFNTPLPADAAGSYTLGFEGRNDATIDMGGGNVLDTEDQAQDDVFAFAVTDAVAMPRRMVVDDYNCEGCHNNLSLHGDNRNNPQYCVTCHQPGETDAVVRPEGTGAPASIHFKYMIHKIHSGAELENGYFVYGYRSSEHDYGHVEYTGDLRNCEKCHVNDSYELPLPAGVLATNTPRDLLMPTEPMAAACVSCHDGDDVVAHVDANTTFFGESCSTCHGAGKDFAVEKVHAR